MAQTARTYNSFGGVNITPTFNGVPIGECQGISYSISREKAPLYTMGSANPRSFSSGKRGIAGSVVFMVFDRGALFDTIAPKDQYFWGNTFESQLPASKRANSEEQVLASGENAGIFQPSASVTTASSGQVSIGKRAYKAQYLDQIPPIDVQLIAQTERGHGAIMEILGMEILNSGSAVSIDDTSVDESCTWIGTNIMPWASQTYTPAFNESTARPESGDYVFSGNTSGRRE